MNPEEMSIEDAKAAMGNATFLQDQLLQQEGAMMSEETAPTDEQLDLETDEGEITEEPAMDPESMKEEIKQEVMAELREELLSELEDEESNEEKGETQENNKETD